MNGLYELTDGKKLYTGLAVIVLSGLLMWLLPDQMMVWSSLFAVGCGLAGYGAADKTRKAQEAKKQNGHDESAPTE